MHEGHLKEIDVEDGTFEIRTADDRTLKCSAGVEQVMELAKEGLDRIVRVLGSRPREVRRRQQRLVVSHIEILDDREIPLL